MLHDRDPALVYLSGPMTNLPNLNVAAFHEARQVLRHHGYSVLCPSESGQHCEDRDRTYHMRRDLMMVMTVEEIVLLPGWERSKGACCEVAVGLELGLPIWLYESGEEITPWLVAHMDLTRSLKVALPDTEADGEVGDCPITNVPFKGASMAYCVLPTGHMGRHRSVAGVEF